MVGQSYCQENKRLVGGSFEFPFASEFELSSQATCDLLDRLAETKMLPRANHPSMRGLLAGLVVVEAFPEFLL